MTSSNQSLKLVLDDQEQHIKAYLLPKTMFPKDSILISLQAEKAYQGFTQSGEAPQPDLMYNGSFLRSDWNILDFIVLVTG